jgi:ubiquinol-cytochrome c reductase cytochrome c1 subunit
VESHTLVLTKPGKLSSAEYDMLVADLVNYLVYMGEPAKMQRQQLGLVVLLFLGIFFLIARALKKEFWKDIH